MTELFDVDLFFCMTTNLSIVHMHEINVNTKRKGDEIGLFFSPLLLSKCVSILQKIPSSGKILHTHLSDVRGGV